MQLRPLHTHANHAPSHNIAKVRIYFLLAIKVDLLKISLRAIPQWKDFSNFEMNKTEKPFNFQDNYKSD